MSQSFERVVRQESASSYLSRRAELDNSLYLQGSLILNVTLIGTLNEIVEAKILISFGLSTMK